MEALLAGWFDKLSFFATGMGLLTTGAVATSIILFWRWRLTLVALFVVQIGVAVLVVRIHGVPIAWAATQLLVMAVCLPMLALSTQQVKATMAARRPGSWVLRGLTVILLLVSWRVFDLALPLPVIAPQIVQLFVWLGLCTLIILSLSDTPFFTGVALLLWCIPVQAVVEILLPGLRLHLLIAIGEILVTLACSYLILTAQTPVLAAEAVVTDLTFAPPPVPLVGLNGSTKGEAPGALPTGSTTGGQTPKKTLPTEKNPDAPFAIGRSR